MPDLREGIAGVLEDELGGIGVKEVTDKILELIRQAVPEEKKEKKVLLAEGIRDYEIIGHNSYRAELMKILEEKDD